MFLCDDCHDPTKHHAMFRSLGKCEGCDRTLPCIDCHYMNCEPREPRHRAQPASNPTPSTRKIRIRDE